MASGIVPRLESVARRLALPPGVNVEYVTLHGEPANELIAFANQFKIDLIAAGAHGRSALGRLLLGSVSSKLVRTAQCSVLVAPPCHGRPKTFNASEQPNARCRRAALRYEPVLAAPLS